MGEERERKEEKREPLRWELAGFGRMAVEEVVDWLAVVVVGRGVSLAVMMGAELKMMRVVKK